jgi:hypothetical protein
MTVPVRPPLKLVTLTMAAVVALSVALALAVALAFRDLKAVVGVDAKGALVPLVSLASPLLSEARVVAFAGECVRIATAHDFLHYTQSLALASACFTPSSADSYITAMQPFVAIMVKNRMVMAGGVVEPPRVIRVKKIKTAGGDVMTWDLQGAIEIFFEGNRARIPPSKYLVELTVTRVPLEGTPRGVLIDRFSMSPY